MSNTLSGTKGLTTNSPVRFLPGINFTFTFEPGLRPFRCSELLERLERLERLESTTRFPGRDENRWRRFGLLGHPCRGMKTAHPWARNSTHRRERRACSSYHRLPSSKPSH